MRYFKAFSKHNSLFQIGPDRLRTIAAIFKTSLKFRVQQSEYDLLEKCLRPFNQANFFRSEIV